MGLAGPRKRQKIGPDPNNTFWTHNEASYGRKIMHAQGWSPGSYLGAKDASHAAHFSAASAAPLRMVPKDDNLGIGAKNAPEENFKFGLQELHNLYGRLNGKGEDTRAAEEAQLAKLNARMYVDNKWGGGMKFVRGGLLVGDSISPEAEEGSAAAEAVRERSRQTAEKGNREFGQITSDGEAQNSSAEEEEEKETTPVHLMQPHHRSKKFKKNISSKSKGQRTRERDLSMHEHTDDVSWKNSESTGIEAENSQIAEGSSDAEEENERERRARREKRRQRREEKRIKRESKRNSKVNLVEHADSPGATPIENKTSSAETTTRENTTEPSTPTERSGNRSGIGGRHTARQRFIRSKKMASEDPRALREILMVTT